EARCSMPDPLPPAVHRHADVELDLAHLERRRVPVAHQVAHEPAVFADLARSAAVRHARSLHDRFVGAHVVDDAYEAVVEHLERNSQNFVEGFDPRPLNAAAFLTHRHNPCSSRKSRRTLSLTPVCRKPSYCIVWPAAKGPSPGGSPFANLRPHRPRPAGVDAAVSRVIFTPPRA